MVVFIHYINYFECFIYVKYNVDVTNVKNVAL